MLYENSIQFTIMSKETFRHAVIKIMKRFKIKKYRLARFCFLFIMILLFSNSNTGKAETNDGPLKIGVLANRGPRQCLNSWSPTADYLSRQIGRRFVIIPLVFDKIYPSVQAGEVDFILANSALYVGLEYWHQASRIATLKDRHANSVYTKYGSVIFCRKDRKEIRSLQDLKGKSFMAVDPCSLGGWLMAHRKLSECGIDPYNDFKELRFTETHDQVVYAVRDRLTDAGTVKTNTLETLSHEGRIDLTDFHVFPQLQHKQSQAPYFCSTREYPNWPMARVGHTPEDLAEKVAVALLQMSLDSSTARAAGCAGWTIPLNYQSVHDCLKALKVGPYKNLGKITIKDLLRTYWYWIFFVCAIFCLLAGFTASILKLNRSIETSNMRLKTEMELRKQKDRELEQAKDMAETATQAKSEFLANMSHEIRTPMNGVIAATDLALGEEVPPKIKHYLNIIHSSAYSLLGIINDILDFSKIEAGKFKLNERVFRLNEVFDQVMDLFVNKSADKGVELLVDIDQDTPNTIKGDPLRLQQILTNLISNAIKFTKLGDVILVHVKVDAETVTHGSAEKIVLAFSVKDTGTGIAPEYAHLLFEPFTQADTSSTRKYEGTGLGLSICKQLVTMMGGDIRVESELGKGSTFFFTVQLNRSSAHSASRLKVPPDIQGLNVLVVDDLADSRLIMHKMLMSLGFKVETLDSGLKALSRLKTSPMRSNSIELILMDWKMPVMNGIEVSRKIRQELKLTLPIIMMTAFGKEKQRIEAEKAEINGFLTKPIYPSTLFDAIMDGFGRPEARKGEHRQHFTTRASIYRKHLKNRHILVAEDNPTNQQVARAILEKAKIEVLIVSNGEEAVKAVQNQPFDAVLMDIQMPRMNGYDATRLIRKLPQGRLIPIVAMTAHAMKGDEEKCLEAGMDGYVSKPINQHRLFQTLWRLVRTRIDSIKGHPPKKRRAPVKAGTGHEETRAEHQLPAPEGATQYVGTLPHRLPGINIREIQANLNIDESTLIRIMKGFLADNQTTIQKLQDTMTGHDQVSLRLLAHSLKGSAANIGAAELTRAARTLEEACCEDIPTDEIPANPDNLIAQVKIALTQVLESIQSLTEPLSNGAPSPVPAETDLKLETVLARLTQAVDQADPEQITKIMPLVRQQAEQWKTIDPADLKTLENQISRYDYDQALETIQKIGQS